jgi:hypothetical protein
LQITLRGQLFSLHLQLVDYVIEKGIIMVQKKAAYKCDGAVLSLGLYGTVTKACIAREFCNLHSLLATK